MTSGVDQKLATGRAAVARTTREWLSIRGLLGALLPFGLAFAVYMLVFVAMDHPGATGDEPHYLVIADSIAYDGDVDLRNNYANEEHVLRIVNVFPLGPHASVYKSSGELRTFRSVGLPTVLAPGLRLGGLTGARVVLILIAALMADQLFRLLRDLRLRRRYRLPAWAAAVFCMPVVIFSSQVYPELAGALLVIVALRVMVVGASRPAVLALGSAAAAALVWLHVRYLLLSLACLAGLALAACVQGWSPDRRARGLGGTIQVTRALVARCAVVLRRRWQTVTVPVLVPYAVVFGLLCIAFQRWYGSPNPLAPNEGIGGATAGDGGWKFWYEFAVRDLLDPIAGWIPFAPVHWLGFAALGCLVLRFGWPAAACVAAAAGYELLVSSFGVSVGWGLPARYPMIVIPLIAVPLAVGIQTVRAARVAFVPLFALSVVFAVAAVRDYGLLYPATDTQRVFGLRSTAPAFPQTQTAEPLESFTFEPGASPSPQTGRVQRGQVVAMAGRDQPGFARYGPYKELRAGRYRSTFMLAFNGVDTEQPAALIDVVAGGRNVLANKAVLGRELRASLTRIDLPFATAGTSPIETRVYYPGRGTLRVGPIRVNRLTPPSPKASFRDWPLAFLWFGGTVFIGWLFVQIMQLTPRRQPKNGSQNSVI
jgi:hypothetical protein